MDAQSKTDAIQRLTVPVGVLEENAHNPNRMGNREFDLLVDNIKKTGLTDPILVRPLPKKGKQPQRYRIVGGHHRFKAALFLEFTEVPITVITDPDFDEEAEQFQLVRMNMIRGRMDPAAFFKLYNEVADKYGDDILQDAFGFAEEAEFKKMVQQASKQFTDPHQKQKFLEAAKEIKTIDGLSKLLNEMFSKYGDTLPYGFMVFDHGGHKSMWLRIEGKTMKALDAIGDICIDQGRTVDDIVGTVLQLIAKGELKDVLAKAVKGTPAVVLPVNLQANPTKEHLSKLAELDG